MNVKLELPGTEMLRARREPSLRVHLARERYVLARIAAGDDLAEVLQQLLGDLEAVAEPDIKSSILELSSDGRRLYHLAAPSLPVSYRTAIDGAEVGEGAGSCGTAVHRDAPVYVSDIAADPLWTGYRDVALAHGLRACWSTPIKGMDDATLGTFAVYYDRPCSPRPNDIEAIAAIALTVALAIERHRSDARLRQARDELAAMNGGPSGA